MPLIQALGCALIAFGPHVTIFTLIIAKDPLKVIVLLWAAFFWLISLVCSSLIWFVVYPLKSYLLFGTLCSVLSQEVCRFLQFRCFKRFDDFIRQVSSNSVIFAVNSKESRITAFVSGCGFGFISALIAFSNLLAASYGPGAMGLKSPQQHFYVTSAIFTLLFSVMHIFWSIIMSESIQKHRKSGIILVLVTHSLASLATFANQYHYYSISFSAVIFVFVITALIAFHKAGANFQKVKQCLCPNNSENVEVST